MEGPGRQTQDRLADLGCIFKTESRMRGLRGSRAGASRADQPLRAVRAASRIGGRPAGPRGRSPLDRAVSTSLGPKTPRSAPTTREGAGRRRTPGSSAVLGVQGLGSLLRAADSRTLARASRLRDQLPGRLERGVNQAKSKSARGRCRRNRSVCSRVSRGRVHCRALPRERSFPARPEKGAPFHAGPLSLAR